MEPRFLLATQTVFTGVPEWQSNWFPSLNNDNTTIPAQSNPTSGAINTVAPRPGDPSTLLVGSVGGGIWRTRNALDLSVVGYRPSWTPLTDRYPSNSIGDLVFDPKDPNNNTLWAAIGRFASGGGDGGPLGGLLRSTDLGDTWVPMGSANVRAQNIVKVVPTLLTDPPTGAQVVLVAGIGALFRSIDGGNNFTQLSGAAGSKLPVNVVSDLVADPSDRNVFYAALPGSGIYRSRDGGVTWDPINNGLTGSNGVTPASRIRLAATRGALYAACVNGTSRQLTGVFRLANPDQLASVNWAPMGVPETPGPATGSITAATNAAPIVITSANHGRTTGTRVRIAGVNGNTNANGDWQITVINANQFSLDGSTGNAAYSGGGSWTILSGIHPEEEEGEEGEDGEHDPDADVNGDGIPDGEEDPDAEAGSQGNTHLSLVADPANANVVYIGGDRSNNRSAGNLFRGTFGATPNVWTPIVDGNANNTAPHADSRDMEFDAQGNIIESDDGGVARMIGVNTGGQTWQSLVGTLEAHTVYSVRATSDGPVFGTQDTGTPGPDRRSESTFTDHYDDYSSGDGAFVGWDPRWASDRRAMYVSNQNLQGFERNLFDLSFRHLGKQNVGLAVSNTGGSNLLKLAAGSTTNSPVYTFDNTIRFIQPFILNAVNPRQMLIGTNFLYESTDGGDNLVSLGGSNNLNTNGVDDDQDNSIDEGDEFTPAGGLGGPINAMAYGGGSGANTNAGVIYAAVGANLFLRQGSVGAPAAIAAPAGVAAIRDIILDPNDWKIAYVVDANGNVFQTNDATATPAAVWTNITGDLGAIVATGAGGAGGGPDLRTIDIYNSGGTRAVFVGGSGGVYFTTDANGAHWREFGNFLPNVVVTDLQYEPGSKTLYAGTWGRGVWSVFNVAKYFTDGNPTTLLVKGDVSSPDERNVITLAADPNIAGLLRLTVSGAGNEYKYSIEANAIDRIRIEGGSGDDTYTISDVPAGVPLDINVGGGNAAVTLGKPGRGILTNILGPVTIRGGAGGTTRLMVDDAADPAAGQTVGVSTLAAAGSITGLTGQPVTYDASANVSNVDILTSGGGNNNVRITATGVPTYVNFNRFAPAATGSTIDIGNAGSVAGIGALLTIADRGVFDTINVLATAHLGSPPITLDQVPPQPGGDPFGRLSGLSPGQIQFKMSDLRQLQVFTGTAATALRVLGPGVDGHRQVLVNLQPAVTVRDMDLDSGLTATDAPNIQVLNNLLGATRVTGASGARLDGNRITTLVLDNTNTVTVSNNHVSATAVVNATTSAVTMTGNTVDGLTTVTGPGSDTLDGNTLAALLLVSTTNITARNNTVTGNVDVGTATNPFSPVTATQFTGNTVRGTMTVNRRSRVVLRNNTIKQLVAAPGTVSAAGRAGAAAGDDADIDAQGNRFGWVDLLATATGLITGNEIGWRDVGVSAPYPVALNLQATFAGPIQNNDVHNAVVGVNYAVASPLLGNRIFGNTTGVVMPVNSTADGLGFYPASGRNEIYNNTSGVNLTGRMQNQYIHDNVTGVIGAGLLGGDVFELANLIASNSVGADFDGTIQFNRFARNAVGVLAHDRQVVIHNLIYRGTVAGVKTNSADDVRIVHNTFYNVAGNAVQADGGSVRVEIINNVFQADGGYALNVADDSRGGYFSDYNDLYTTGPGLMLRWRGVDFDDVVDLQQDIYRFDLHSIGTSAASPGFAAPRFLDLANDDYRVPALTGNQHLSSPTIDAGAPFIDVPAPPGFRNLLTNGSFETGSTAGWTVNVGGGTATADPFVYAGTRYFAPGGVAAGFAEQTVDLVAAGYTAAQLDGNSLAAVFGGRVRSAAESPLVDEGRLVVTFLDGAGAPVGAATTITSGHTTDRWELLGGRLAVPAGARSFRYRFEATRLTGSTDDAFLDAAFVWLRANTAAPDLGAFGGNAGTEIEVTVPHLQVLAPTLYADWEAADPHVIEWQTFGNTTNSPVRIQVFKDGAGAPFPITIAGSAPDQSRFTWIPETSGLTPGTKGLRIQVSLVSDPSVSDRSAEPFALPESGHVFYVNDGSLAGDEYATAVGDNRNTGRTPGSPKPSLEALLRTYRLGAADVVYIDTGVYDHVDTIVLGGNQQVGGDQGVTITGPLNPAHIARINGPAGSAVFDVSAANLVTLTHLTLAGGAYAVWVRNGGGRFTGSYLTSLNPSLDGVRVEDGVTDVTLDHLAVSGAGRDGVSVDAPNVTLTNSTSHHNARYGIYFGNAGNAVLTGNESYNNRQGLNITNRVNGTTARVGDPNLALSLGNKFHDNAEYGVWTSAPGAAITVAGNAVTNNGGSGAASTGVGILLGDNSTSATANVVSGHYRGIVTSGGPVTNNRVFDSADHGIAVFGAAAITGNVVYRNRVGMYTNMPFAGPTLRNNLVYANTLRGIWLNGSSNPLVESNTVYQPAGDALRVDPYVGESRNAFNVVVRNNILWSGGPAANPPAGSPPTGFALAVDASSEVGFRSDYNLLFTSGTGKIGLWEGAPAATLSDWRTASSNDANSLSKPPAFVDADGADNVLGNNDDDFHEQSTAGSFHGGSLAPVISATTGLPVAAPGNVVNDAALSPALDRGDPTSPYTNETAPSGGAINLGAFGNTAQASRSPMSYVTVLQPDGGESVLAGHNFSIRWTSQDTAGTVLIELLNGPTVVNTIAASAPNSGAYVWTVPTTVAAGSNYFVRVTRNGVPTATDTTDAPFNISGSTQLFYVNDGTFAAGDWTTAAGNDANSGLDPAHPKATIQSVLATYNLGAGDVIRVDAGAYALSTNVGITAGDSGVKIEGFHDAAFPARKAVLTRPAAAGSVVFDFQGADDVTLDYLTLAGGGATVGIFANAGADSDRVTLTHLDVSGFGDYGLQAHGTNDNWTVASSRFSAPAAGGFWRTGMSFDGIGGPYAGTVVRDNVVFGFARYGIAIEGGGAGTLVTGNEVYNNGTGLFVGAAQNAPVTVSGNKAHDNTAIGILASGPTTTVTGNTAWNQTDVNAYGIQTQNGATTTGNVTYNNGTGIYVFGGGAVTNNRSYGNARGGIFAGGSDARGNVVYNNQTGIEGSGSPVWANNLVYSNSAFGMVLRGASAPLVINNTVYQPAGDALTVESTHNNLQFQNIRVRNNIIWALSGYAFAAGTDVAPGFASDFNDLYVTGTGKVGLWEGQARPTLLAWQQATFNDANSFSADPLFVSVASFDFHEQSTHGSFHGGSLAPVLDGATGLPAPAAATETNDAADSPAIDSGAPTDPAASEPAPNGGFVNLGAFGNTGQASKSAATWLRVTRPNGGESWSTRQTFPVLWRGDNPGSGLVDIDLMHRGAGGTLTLERNLASGVANNGRFDWAVPQDVPAGTDYVVRVTRRGTPNVVDASDNTFAISAGTGIYYVNDNTVLPGDWTTAPGDDANSGLDPAHPKASVSAILAAYALGATDVIRVDRGVYLLSNNITVTTADSGVTIRGFTGDSNTNLWRASVIGDGPTRYYRFGEASGTTATDSSGNSVNATYVNGVSLGQGGALDQDADTAAAFNGTNQYVDLGTGFTSFPNGFSFETWVYPTSNGNYSRIFDLGNGPDANNVVLYRQGASNNLGFNVWANGSYGTEILAPNALTPNVWQHIAVTQTAAGVVTLYKNGAVVATGTTKVPASATRTKNYLGRSNYTQDAYFAGKMDEAAFFDKVLTPAQISGRAQLALKQAVLNRNSTATNAFVFDLQGADDVTIDRLAMTGAYMAVYGGFNADSDRVTISNNEIYGSAWFGMYVGGQNEDWTLAGNRIHDNYVNVRTEGAARLTITGNLVYNSTYGGGIDVGNGQGSTVSGNEVFGNNSSGITADNTTLTNNLIHDNKGAGLVTYGGTLATGNTVYGQSGRFAPGISNQGGEVRGNTVYGNYDGITMNSGLTAGNRVFNNANVGIGMTGGVAERNTVYSNDYGITGNYGVIVRGNLVYANKTLGVWINPANSAVVEGNTVYQLAGDALRVTLDTNNTRLAINRVRDNILWAAGAGGYAFNVPNDVETAIASDYNDLYATGGAVLAHFSTQDFANLRDWQWELGQDLHSISADPQFVDADGADNVLGYAGGADHGADDDFRLRPGSPTIDAGDPLASFGTEPQPDGQRVNLGNYGGTPGATASGAAQSVQVVSPNGGEKTQAGRPVTVEWVSNGLTQTRVVGLFDIGGDGATSPAGDWGDGDSFATTRVTFGNTNAPDRSGVTDAGPAAVYTNFAFADNGVGKFIGYRIPVADGTYTIRLHFNEGFVGTGQRMFDVKLQGAVARANYDVYAAAGGYYKAVALSLPVTATGGGGISLELVNKTVNPAFLCGIDIFAVNPAGVASPTADVQFSSDGGANWTTVGSAVAMDARGRGRFTFTPSAASDNALVRVVARDGSRPQDASDAPFQVAPQGRNFYVNDGSLAGDVFTTAVGNNANSGKSPDKPMATLAALLASYDLDPGDVIHMDAGTYELFHNIWMLPQDSGVRIEGAGAAVGAAAGTGPVTVLDRNNVNSLMFDFRGADNVTLDHLSLTGASVAVYAYFGVDSDGVSVTNSDVFGNPDGGIQVNSDNDRWSVVGNRVHDSQGAGRTGSGVSFNGNFLDVAVRNNVVFNNPRYGIILNGNYASALPVTGNLAYGNGTGIWSNVALVTANEAHHNTTGLFMERTSSLGAPSGASDNLVYSNGDGIVVSNNDGLPPVFVDHNRVFNSTGTGIVGGGNGIIRNNTVYSNRVGIAAPTDGNYGGGQVYGNVVYANADRGIFVTGNGARLMNNTVYQLVGDAVRVQGAANITLLGNLLWVEGGADLYVAPDGQNGFKSDSNLLYHGPGASAFTGFWGGANRASLADWQAASSQDGRSVAGNPAFVDVDGADNVLGYNPAGNGYDGGTDDDFYLSAGSPGIDHGYSWSLAGKDLEGFARADDPGTANAGSPDYAATPRATSAFAQSGTLLLGSNNTYANFDLPFAFPIYGASYTRVVVSTEGVIHFEGPDAPFNGANNDAEFLRNRRVAPMWDNINVSGAGNGVFADATVAGQVKFTWKGVNEANGQPVNFSAVLFSDGKIRFDYGAGNTGLTPTVGVSMGDGVHFMKVAGYDGAAALTGAASVDVGFVPGFADAGAYEFRGSSSDVTAPTVTATIPAAVGTGGAVVVAVNEPRQIGITFSEPVNSIDARAAGNFVLTGAGRDGVFGTADDFVLSLVPRFVAGSRDVTLDLPAGFPETGLYRLTVLGSPLTSMHDLSGLRLDGNGDGTPGGDFVRTFTVTSDGVAPTVAGVWVGSQKWTGAFANALQSAGLGSATLGYAVVGGAGQLASLPWSNLDRVSVRFSEGVAVAADDLTVGGVNVLDYGVSSFTYDPATFTATWTLARPVTADKLLLRVDGGAGGVRDLAGNRLDGDWSNPPAAPGVAGQFPSGNGSPGGDFLLRLNVLAGDVTRDLRADAVDLLRLRSRVGASLSKPGSGAGAYGVIYDLNGDGRVNVVDVELLRATNGRKLPVDEPTAPPPLASVAATPSQPPVFASRRVSVRRTADYLLSNEPGTA